jgi:membrane protein required for beta-lactamase induction
VATCAYCGADTRLVGEVSAGVVVVNDPALRARIQKEMADRVADEDAKKADEQRLVKRASLVVFLLLFLVIFFSAVSSRR